MESDNHTGGHPNDSLNSTDLKNKYDIKGIVQPRAKIIDDKIYLLCPVDGTLCRAVLSHPYNGRNYTISCSHCCHEYFIGLDKGRHFKHNYERIEFADLIGRETIDEIAGFTEAA